MPRVPRITVRNTRAEFSARTRKKIGPAVDLLPADVQIGLLTLARIARCGDPIVPLYGAMLEGLDGCAEMLKSGMLAGAYVQGRSVLEHGLQLLYGMKNFNPLLCAAFQENIDALLAAQANPDKPADAILNLQARLFAQEEWRMWHREYLEKSEKNGYPPRWYSVAGGPGTLKKLADEVKLQHFYGFYSRWSAVVHGAEAREKHTGDVLDLDGDPAAELIAPLHMFFCLVTTRVAARDSEETFTAFRRDLVNKTTPLLRAAKLPETPEAMLQGVDSIAARTPAESIYKTALLRKVSGVNPGRARQRMTALMGPTAQKNLNFQALSSRVFLDLSRDAAYDTHVARALLGLYRQCMESFNAFVSLIFAGCIVPAAVQARTVIDLGAQFQYLVRRNNEHLAAACLVAGRIGAAWSKCADMETSVPAPDDLTRQEVLAWRDLDSLRCRESRPVQWYSLLRGPRNVDGLLRAMELGFAVDYLHALNREVHQARFVGFLSPDALEGPRTRIHDHWVALVQPCSFIAYLVGTSFARYFRPDDEEYAKALGLAVHEAIERRANVAPTSKG